MDGNARNKIRKAQKSGVVCKLNCDFKSLVEIYRILQKVYKRAQLPLPPLDFFENIITTLGKQNGFLKIFKAVHQEKVVAARLILAYKNSLYDWYAGSLQEFNHLRPNDLLVWEILKWGCENGFDFFDFGGAGKPGIPYGVRDYKLKFGGKVVNFGRYQKVHHPLKMALAKIGLRAWQWMKFRKK